MSINHATHTVPHWKSEKNIKGKKIRYGRHSQLVITLKIFFCLMFDPFNAEVTLVQSTWTQIPLKTI